MSQNLNLDDRIKIQTLFENNHKPSQISKYIGCSRSTIYRELPKGYDHEGNYDAYLAQSQVSKNLARAQNKSPSPDLVKIVEEKIINDQWSPMQISGWLKLNHHESISHTWIYQHIYSDKRQGGELYDHIRHGPYTKGHKEYRGNIINRVSIEERPDVVNQRTRLGDFEIDLIVGPKNRGAILTMIDRLGRKCVLEKLPNKSADTVAQAIIKSLNHLSDNVYTITSDNGTEFSLHEKIKDSLEIQYYFAHPYASYERGSIENLNGLVRQYIPKGTDFSTVTPEYVKEIEGKLNNRPRKVLGFLTPIEYTHKMLRIAA